MVELPFYAAIALAGAVFVAVDAADRKLPVLREMLPLPVTAGLLGALILLATRIAGTPVAVPHQGVEVDFLIALLTTNMGLHLSPKVLRRGLPLFALFLAAGFCLFWLQLAVAFALAQITAHPLETAILTGPLAYVGAPFNLNPPQQVPPVAALFRPAFPDPEGSAQGMMMLGVLLGPVLASWISARLFRRTGSKPPQPPAQRQETPSTALTEFGQRETWLIALILGLIALAFLVQAALLRYVPGLTQAHVPVIVITYLLGGLTRYTVERAGGGSQFPEAALTILLIGPTMSFVLTYAVMSVPLHHLAMLTPTMAAAGLLAILASGAFGWLMFPVFAWAAGKYYGAVISTVFVAVTTGWGPVAMSFLRRSTDEQGEVEPMPAILPLNAFYIFPWMVIILTELLLG